MAAFAMLATCGLTGFADPPPSNEALDKKTDEELLAGAWRFTKVRAKGDDLPVDFADQKLGFELRMTFTTDGKGTNDFSDPDPTDGMEGFKYKLSGRARSMLFTAPTINPRPASTNSRATMA
jgi:hypothetical protein